MSYKIQDRQYKWRHKGLVSCPETCSQCTIFNFLFISTRRRPDTKYFLNIYTFFYVVPGPSVKKLLQRLTKRCQYVGSWRVITTELPFSRHRTSRVILISTGTFGAAWDSKKPFSMSKEKTLFLHPRVWIDRRDDRLYTETFIKLLSDKRRGRTWNLDGW